MKLTSNTNLVSSMTSNVFVQKLFTMLQTPDVQDSVRWSPTGDSFQILDTNKFTSSVLPKHFNNGNFASFVRQLNKYDFHKIKTNVSAEAGNNDGTMADINPNNIWEFKHPDFQLHNMELLENIKRKVPSQRKKFPNKDCCSSNQDQLMEVEQELQTLKENYSEICTRLDEVMLNYKWAIENINRLIETNKERDNTIKYLLSLVPKPHQAPVVASPLEALSSTIAGAGPYGSSDSVSAAYRESQNKKYNNINNNMSTINGNLPAGDNLNNTLKDNNMIINNNVNSRKITKKMPNAGFERLMGTVPNNNGIFRVLLVEDDEACINICRQILILYGCEVDVVTNGLSAVDIMKQNDNANNPNNRPYNLILMDIIMPTLDGVSASGLIREFNKVTPIIAMPANDIGQNDINNYMHNGMNDVLTKPFSKASLYAVLDKYLKRI